VPGEGTWHRQEQAPVRPSRLTRDGSPGEPRQRFDEVVVAYWQKALVELGARAANSRRAGL
jgi:hypothetical protein